MAVFRPFKHAQLRHKLNKWMLAISILILTIQTIFTVFNDEIVWQVSLALDGAVVLVCLAILAGAYAATALKLYDQGRAIRPQTQRTDDAALETIGRAIDAAKTPQELARAEQQPAPAMSRKRAMHVRALKIYTAIFLVFVLTNSMAVALNLLKITYFVYVYHIKFLANPVIYYCFVEKFRNSVKEYWRRLSGR